MTDREYGYSDAELSHANRYLIPTVKTLLVDLPQNASVLDLGCGNGSMTAALSRPDWRMHGMDASESGIRLAQQHFPSITFCFGLIEPGLVASLGADRFDAIVCAEVVEHMYYPRDLARCAFALLRPGGRFVITTPYHGYVKNCLLAFSGKMDRHWSPLWDGGHIKFWSPKTLRILLEEPGFTDLTFHGVGRIPFLWKSMVFSCSKPLRAS